MIRRIFAIATLVTVLFSSTDLMAQQRRPLRNLVQQLGARWGTGFHHHNPAWRSDYYQPWSEHNTPLYQQPSNDDGVIETPDARPSTYIPMNGDQSASQWLIRQKTTQSPILNSAQHVNRYLVPYHRNKSAAAIQLETGGPFQINSTRNQNDNSGWTVRQPEYSGNDQRWVPKK